MKMNDSNSKIIRERFLNTLLEIADKVKQNSDAIDTSKVLSLIELIIKINLNDGRIFTYGAGRS